MVRRLASTAALLLVGSGVLLTTTRPAGATEAYGATVTAIDSEFSPSIVRIDLGDAVEWSNDGRSPHTITADDGSLDSGDLPPGAGFERTFDEPGVFTYSCRYHGSPGVGMTGTIVVGDAHLPGPTGDVGPGGEPVPGGYAETVRVPQDAPTIQGAVDRARPGAAWCWSRRGSTESPWWSRPPI